MNVGIHPEKGVMLWTVSHELGYHVVMTSLDLDYFSMSHGLVSLLTLTHSPKM